MQTIAEVLAEQFAEHRVRAESLKSKIVAERNLALASCVIAFERGDPRFALPIYEATLRDQAISPTGAVDTSNWRDAIRMITANIEPIADCGDPEQVLITLGTGNNPYKDLCKASHPSSGTAKIFS